MKGTRIIYDKDFYTIQAIMLSKKFVRLEKQFHNSLKAEGISFPKNGFKTVNEYHAWQDKYADKLPDSYYGFMENILEEFGIKAEDKFRQGLSWYFLFGHKKAPIKGSYKIGSEISDDKQTVEVSLTIFPWTKKEDLENIWMHIEPLQVLLPGYVKRNREWITFERDFKVYELFIKVVRDLEKGKKPDAREKSVSAYVNIQYYPEFETIKKKYKSVNLEDSIISIVSRCRKEFGFLKLL